VCLAAGERMQRAEAGAPRTIQPTLTSTHERVVGRKHGILAAGCGLCSPPFLKIHASTTLPLPKDSNRNQRKSCGSKSFGNLRSQCCCCWRRPQPSCPSLRLFIGPRQGSNALLQSAPLRSGLQPLNGPCKLFVRCAQVLHPPPNARTRARAHTHNMVYAENRRRGES